MTKIEPLSFRIVQLNNAPANASSKFLHNKISTAKYSMVTFLFKFLYEQFSKYANMFFLVTVFIQVIYGLMAAIQGDFSHQPICDYDPSGHSTLCHCHQGNPGGFANSSPAHVLHGSTFMDKKWEKVVVGDILRIESDESFPADMIVLSSSEPDGLCYIETANLDGETNLKIRQALQETTEICNPQAASEFQASIKTEMPNNSLYTFEGTLRLEDKELPLSPEQVLLRGAVLRNTNWVYGAVIFTGHETKLLKNSRAMPVKRSNIEKMTNTQILFLGGILVFLAVFSAITNSILTNAIRNSHYYLRLEDVNSWTEGLKKILTFMILYNNLIPISLIVTMEVVKFQQSSFINSDLDMYYEETDTPAVARTSTLVEELGQVEYVFSDKTGTLTCNRMEFKQCIIAAKSYLESLAEDDLKAVLGVVNPQTGFEDGHFSFEDLKSHLLNLTPSHQIIREFLIMMSVCHTVIPEEDSSTGSITYQASSPDEAAIVKGAATLGYKFVIRRPKSVTITAFEEAEEYEILNVIEFNSTRKRMSVIVRCPDGKIKLYCKGADTVILARLAPDNPYVDRTLMLLEECATVGLRTLCFGYREIDPEEYETWNKSFEKAVTTINNRAEEIDKVAETIETKLFLLGATAIEDKLQEGVPETIHILKQAGIKVWVLTGDRQETAINIGYSCKLLSDDMQLIILNEPTHAETKASVESKLQQIKASCCLGSDEVQPNYGLVISGKTLDFVLEKDIQLNFLQLAQKCKSVICCRVSPLQKALVVKLVKKNTKSITLAIGDGANDVNMIQTAHVGVGINGLEGLQAARSADYAIGQFRFLKKLLLVHGAWSYHRLSKLILYSFYKNITLYLTQFWFAAFNLYSGQTLFESWTISFYNVAFTVFPPLVIGIFDQHASQKQLSSYPHLYQLGVRKEFFNVKNFWGCFVNAVLHSLLLFFAVSLVFQDDLVLQSGFVGGQWFMGLVVYSVVLVTVILKAALITNYWTKFTFYSIFGSLIIWFTFIPIYSHLAPKLGIAKELFGISYHLYTSPVFWICVVVLPCLCLTRDFMWKYMKRQYRPSSYHIAQELQKYDIPDYRPRIGRFKQTVQKVRALQRLKKVRGFAFSQGDSGQAQLIRKYDTTKEKPSGL